MQFVHISDNHLGYRQYNIDEREKDLYDSFNQCIDKIIEIKPDFVVHSGDLFDGPEPPINAIYTAMQGFSRLKEHNIPIYIIHGNHDKPKRITKGSPFKILKNVLGSYLRVFTEKTKFHVHDGEVFIGGINHTVKNKIGDVYTNLEIINNESKDYKKKILLFHQNVYPYLPEYELQLNDFPGEFDYFAGGHIHQRALKPAGEESGVFAYSGSTEIISYDEYRDHEKNGKGFYLVDMSGDFDINDVESIHIKCRDFIIDWEIKSESELKEFLNTLNNHNQKKPVIHCKTTRQFYETLNEILKEKSLYYKLNVLEDSEESAHIVNINENIDEVFKEYLRNKKFDVDFVYELYRKVLNGDEDCLPYVEDYFKKEYSHLKD